MPTRDRIVELCRVRAGDLIDHPASWRRHPEAQRQALAELLARVGFADAVLARRAPEGLVLLDGHLRKDLDPDAELPVLVLDVTEEEGELILASLDPLAAMAVADEEALAQLLESVKVPDGLLEILSRSLGGPLHPGRTDPDVIPKLRRRGRVRRGELWKLGQHRLLRGDARSGADLHRLMGTEEAQVLWTDPPYGVAYIGRTTDALTLSGDDADGLQGLLGDSFAAADQALAPGARLYVCHPAGALSLVFESAFVAAGWRHHQTLIWVKDTMVLGHSDYHFRHEPLLFGYKPGPGRWGRGGHGWFAGNDEDSVFEVPRPRASKEHPTAKPTELISRCLSNSSRVGELVLDPFAGSGSTMIACQELGRAARLVEIDASYCDLIVRRFEAFTGDRACRIDGP